MRVWIYAIIGIILYIIPGLTMWGIGYINNPIQPSDPLSGGIADLGFIIFSIFFLIFLVIAPIILMIFQPFIMIPYLILSYGLLYYFYRRQKQQPS